MVKVKFKKGAVGYIHDHFHSQVTYVASGKFKVTINETDEIFEAGDGFFVQPNLHMEPNVSLREFSLISYGIIFHWEK